MPNSVQELGSGGLKGFLGETVIYETFPVTRRTAMKITAMLEQCWTAVGDVAELDRAPVGTIPMDLQPVFEQLSKRREAMTAHDQDGDGMAAQHRLLLAYQPAREH